MNNIVSALDLALIALWTTVLLGSYSISSEDLLFGWPVQVHLVITALFIGLKLTHKRFIIKA